MDLRFTPEEIAFRQEVRAFIKENLRLVLTVEGSVIWEYKETDDAGHTQNILGVQLIGPTMLLAAMQNY